ncbi:MAG: translation initiation factor IF-1 [Acidimicrobiales bacterium]
MQPWPWGLLTVELDRGGLIDAHRAAALRLRLRRIRAGDRVDLQEVVPGRGRIVRRLGPFGDG